MTKPGPVAIPAAPLMHGTGAFNAMSILMAAGSIVTLEGRSLRRRRAARHRRSGSGSNSLSIVGDAFAKPILRALDAEPDRWDVSSLRVIVSSGVMWSQETKEGLLRHNPSADHDRLARLVRGHRHGPVDHHRGRRRRDGEVQAQRLHPRRRRRGSATWCRAPASSGRVALRGRTPLGYYKDPEKSATTFVVIDGVRYSIPGDFAEVDADGTVKLLGRGSVCINTGGEKVYPEEVEEVLKLHPGVADAVVVGVPDERFGEAVTALVEPVPGTSVDEAALDRPRAGPPLPLQGAQAGARPRHHRAGPERQGGLPAPEDRSRQPPERRLTLRISRGSARHADLNPRQFAACWRAERGRRQ